MSAPELTGDCRFCRIAHGQTEGALGPIDRAWYRDGEYIAVASVGALVEGWSLIVPTAHSFNMTKAYGQASFYSVASAIVDRVEACYGPCAIFEHGAFSVDSATSCGTAHAHLHVVPLALDLECAARDFDSALCWERVELHRLTAHVGEQEYLLASNRFEGPETICSVATLTQGRSQFFRKVIARHLGKEEEFSYREFPRLETSLATSLALRTPQLALNKVA